MTEIEELEEVTNELIKDLAFLNNKLYRMINDKEKTAIWHYYRCSSDIAVMCPKCRNVSFDIAEHEPYQELKVPLEKDAICKRCKE